MLERYLTAKEVRARLGGISDMTLWRYLNNDNIGFPQPVIVRRRRLFREADVAAWINAQSPASDSAA